LRAEAVVDLATPLAVQGATICALGSVSFRPKLTSAATDAQSQVSAPADIRHPNMNDRNQSVAAVQSFTQQVWRLPPKSIGS